MVCRGCMWSSPTCAPYRRNHPKRIYTWLIGFWVFQSWCAKVPSTHACFTYTNHTSNRLFAFTQTFEQPGRLNQHSFSFCSRPVHIISLGSDSTWQQQSGWDVCCQRPFAWELSKHGEPVHVDGAPSVQPTHTQTVAGSSFFKHLVSPSHHPSNITFNQRVMAPNCIWYPVLAFQHRTGNHSNLAVTHRYIHLKCDHQLCLIHGP